MKLSIIIVSYNTAELTLACIKSVYEQTSGIDFEVFVVDNNSHDNSAELIKKHFPEVRLFALKENLGFSAANNFAAAETESEYLLLLNPDTVVLEGAINKIVAFADKRPDAGVFGGSTFHPDGSRNPTSAWSKPSIWSLFVMGIGLVSIFRKSRFFNPESYSWWNWKSIREVDIVSGCFLLIRKELWDKLEGFDLTFFMYAEDADLCMRTWKTGSKCIINPDFKIIHFHGASEKVRADKMIRLFTAKALLFKKHWNPVTARYGTAMLSLYAFSRMLTLSVLKNIKKSLEDDYKSWKKVWDKRRQWAKARLKKD
jgi:N-acetylglucosaminyl-diphospho-decaprenol L-rhamnosyltransferase